MVSADPRRALSFGSYADAYELWRPTYPDDSVAWLVPPHASRVADVGAGTGKLTARLLERGLQVDAVEPDPDMLEVLRQACPAATPHLAGAGDLPLPEAGVDAVLAADAWHWFPHAEALDEVRRVVRPGGWLGLVWNLVTPVEPWEYALAGLDPDDKDTAGGGSAPVVPGLEDETFETASFPWTWMVTPAHVRAYTATHSGVAALDEVARTRKLDESEAIVARACAAAQRPAVPMRHSAFCVRWRP